LSADHLEFLQAQCLWIHGPAGICWNAARHWAKEKVAKMVVVMIVTVICRSLTAKQLDARRTSLKLCQGKAGGDGANDGGDASGGEGGANGGGADGGRGGANDNYSLYFYNILYRIYR
jgi:uncharacterized membrane protein YgcG